MNKVNAPTSRIRLLALLGLAGCITVQAPPAPAPATEAPAPATEVAEPAPEVTESEQCDVSLLTKADIEDPEFIFGAGVGTSRMLSLARSQGMARARADLATRGRTEISLALADTARSRGANPLNATLSASLDQMISESSEGLLVNVRLADASLCEEGELWNYIALVRMRPEDFMTGAIENFEAMMVDDIEDGSAEATMNELEDFSRAMQDILDARLEQRRPGGKA